MRVLKGVLTILLTLTAVIWIIPFLVGLTFYSLYVVIFDALND